MGIKSLHLQTGEPNLIYINIRGKSRSDGALPAPQMNIHGQVADNTAAERPPLGRGRERIRLISLFLLSAILSLVQYSLKVTVTNSDKFNTIDKLGEGAKK